MKKVSIFKRLWAEALPFVARSPEMKVAWLVDIFSQGVLTSDEIAPYMHLLLSEYESSSDIDMAPNGGDGLEVLFSKVDRPLLARMIQCTEIYDLPVLLSLIRDLSVDEAVLALRKEPPVYEKKWLLIIDKVFQAVNGCGDGLLELAAEKMTGAGGVPAHFMVSYERFKEILHDEKILSELYPQAKP